MVRQANLAARAGTLKRLYRIYLPLPDFPCPYCTRLLGTEGGRTRHIAQSPSCNAAQARDIQKAQAARREARAAGVRADFLGVPIDETKTNASRPTHPSPPHPPPPAAPESPAPWTDEDRIDEALGLGDDNPMDDSEMHGEPVVEQFPNLLAGQPISDARVPKPNLLAYMRARGNMSNPSHFEVAELLMTSGMTNKVRDRHLKSRKYRGKTPWANVGALMKAIDKLPHGPGWSSTGLKVQERSGERITVVYMRNIVDIVRDLIGNRQFDGHIRYAPERQWMSDARTHRVYSEAWTGNWWWRMQHLMKDPHATIAPLIIATDKTTLSLIGGNQQAYPVYLTIGNISKDLRRKSSARATILVGYLPVEDFKDEPDKLKRQVLKAELQHRAMQAVMQPLEEVSATGVNMWCADGQERLVVPILAAYVADFPEQSSMACTSQARCPICTIKTKNRGRGDRKAPVRERPDDLVAMRSYHDTNDLAELAERGLKPWWPFWARLPYVNFGLCVTPDLLHQVHKGVFKSHLAKWLACILGTEKIDKRFRAMTRADGMRHFSIGISGVQQWTGRESKEMAMQFLPIVAESTAPEMVELTRAVLDFMYQVHAARMTEGDVKHMEESWATVHRLKHIIVTLGALPSMASFNGIPKFHMLSHYAHSICELGTADGYNTEAPEHLHIEYAKKPWRASNGVNALPQMIAFIQRQEAIRIQRAYLDAWYSECREARWRGEGGKDEGSDSDEDEEHGDEEGGWIDSDGDENGNAEMSPDASPDQVHYPDPGLAIAHRPSVTNITAHQVARLYNTPDLLAALNRFLETQTTRDNIPHLSPHCLLNVWHRFSLYQRPLPFAPGEPARRDVVRAKPASYDTHGRILRASAFNTVLFRRSQDEDKHGIHRYRAGRVRAIFQLPNHVRQIYPHQLAYIELFAPFSPSPGTAHGMHTTSHDLHFDGKRRILVVPITDIVMSCHIAPRFSRLDPDVPLHKRTDLLSLGRRFFFNQYTNHYVYPLFQHWRRKAQRGGATRV